MADESAKPEKSSKRSRSQREAEVRRKYDFSVIRALRQERGHTIEKFAKLCGLSYAPISRIETNLIKPNLDTLDKIAGGLGITTYSLVAMAEKREAEKIDATAYDAGGFRLQTYSYDGVDVAYGSAEKGSETTELDMRQRDYESLIVQSGAVEVTINDERFEVAAGESLRYDRIFPRTYRVLEDAELIVVSHSKRG